MKNRRRNLTKPLSLALAVALLAGVLLVTASAAEFDLPQMPDWDALARDSGSTLDHDFGREVQRSANMPQNDLPVFYLILTNGSQKVCVTAFYVRDPATGSAYLLSHGAVGAVIEKNGLSCSLVSLKGSGEAEYLGKDDFLSYFRCDILSNFTPMELGNTASDLVDIHFLGPDESGNPKEILSIVDQDLTQWESENGIIFMDTETETDSTLFIGMPVASAKDGAVIGVTFLNQYLGILRFGGTNFALSQEYALSAAPGGKGGSEETKGTDGTDVPDKPDGPVEPKDNTKLYLIIGAAAVAAFLFYRNKKKGGRKPEQSREGSISLEPGGSSPAGGAIPGENAYQPNYGQDIYGPTVPNPAAAPQPSAPKVQKTTVPVPENGTLPLALWQLRGVEGPLRGKVYPLSGSLIIGRSAQCGVRFSQDTPGISGTHCQVTVKGDKVYLQDLDSSYGTFYPQNNRLNPRIDCLLHEGGVFILAQSGGAFRLEKAGAAADASCIVIKDMNEKAYRSDASMRITLGRNPGCQGGFGSGESSVSGRHCELYREGGKLYLMDLGSTNGTFFSQQERLKPNVPYRIRKGMAFFLTTPKYTFVVVEE